jgi:CubicO group peptidase (beta-lactamase class C family)
VAVGHQYWFGMPFAAPNMPFPPGALPGGGLISSAEDMARYLIALLNGGRYGDVQILSEAGIDELQRGVADVRAMGISLGQYGMGWFTAEIGQARLVWHSGTLPDFAAYMALLPEQKKGVVLLFNACHHWMNPVLTEVGMGVTALLAGEQPRRSPVPLVGLFPWMLRGQLLIPALQITVVVATLRRVRRWRLDPDRRPDGGRAWALQILLPLIPDLLAVLSLRPMLSKRRGYLLLYKPDSSWLSLVCGSFALAWSLVRTGLIFVQKRSSPSAGVDPAIGPER